MQKQLIQGTQEWLEMRKNYLGSSDAPVIMGVSPWRTPYQLWEEKQGLLAPQPSNPAMQRGIALEPQARQAYIEHTGTTVVPQVLYHREHKWMMASLDGVDDARSIAVEIKTPGKFDHDIARQGKIPDKYYPQLQHQLEVLCISVIHYFSWSEESFHLIEVKRDDEYIADMCQKESEFWDGVLNFVPPKKKYKKRSDKKWSMLMDRLLIKSCNVKLAKKEYAEVRDEAIEEAGDESCSGGGLNVLKIPTKGNIAYDKIPELRDVDLEKYRKPTYTKWRITES